MINTRPLLPQLSAVGFMAESMLFVLKDSHLNQCLFLAVCGQREFYHSGILAFVIRFESDRLFVVNVEILMVLENGEIRAFQASNGDFGALLPIQLAMLVNAMRHMAGRLPLPAVLILVILAFSVEKASAQIVNGDFSSGATGWTTTAAPTSAIPNGSAVFSANQVTVTGDDNGPTSPASSVTVRQTFTAGDPGFLTALLRSYTSTDSANWDAPTVFIDGTLFKFSTAGALISLATNGVQNSSPATNLTVRRSLAAGSRTVGFGVYSLDNQVGPGVAIWDDIVFQELTQSPGAQTTPFNTALTLSGANAPQVATNSAAASMSVTLSVTNGTLTLGSTAGITITAGANGSATMTFTGSPANINNAMNNLVYTPTTGFSGASTLTFFANGGGISDTDTIAITVQPPTFLFTIAKTTPTTTVSAAGTLITYTVTVTNTGTGALTGITITDNVLQGAASTALTVGSPTGDGGVIGTMEAGEVWVYTIAHTVTQAQMDDAGNLVNTATFDTAQTVAQSASATTTVTASPSLSLVKSSSAPGFTTDNILEAPAGTVVTYTYTVTNTGNQTISNIDIDDSGHTGLGPWSDPVHVGLTDNLPTGGSTDTNPSNNIWGALGPNDVVTFSTTYTITQADIDAQ